LMKSLSWWVTKQQPMSWFGIPRQALLSSGYQVETNPSSKKDRPSYSLFTFVGQNNMVRCVASSPIDEGVLSCR
jgi:hypothetical protein